MFLLKNKCIISFAIIYFFVSIASTHAYTPGALWEVFDLPYGVEQMRMDFQTLPSRNFPRSETTELYQRFVYLDQKLQDEVMNLYYQNILTVYEVNDFIRIHETYLYHTQKTFDYIALKQSGVSGKDIESALLSSYTSLRATYMNMQNILNK